MLLAALGGEVSDEHGPSEAGPAEGLLILGAVEHHAETLAAAVLGHVEAEGEQLILPLPVGRADADELGRVVLDLLERGWGNGLELERGRNGGGGAGTPAGLDVEAAAGRVADGYLLGVGRCVGGECAPGGVEHRNVPVALGAGKPDRDLPRARGVNAAGRDAGSVRHVRAVAGGGLGSARGAERPVQKRLRLQQRLARSGERGRAAGEDRKHGNERERDCEGDARHGSTIENLRLRCAGSLEAQIGSLRARFLHFFFFALFLSLAHFFNARARCPVGPVDGGTT